MERLSTLGAWREYAGSQRAAGRRVGLVPTMGALHAGHSSLFEAAKQNGDVVLATIFVNPRQFNDVGDLNAYPRTPQLDHHTAEQHGVDCLVEPTLAEMWPDYPAPTSTTVSVRGISDTLEGAGRPGHFDGVASVVAKLFAVTGPCRAYFEHGLTASHYALRGGPQQREVLEACYKDIANCMNNKTVVLLHSDEVSDRLLGVIAGYLVWTKKAPTVPTAVALVERLFKRSIGPDGRTVLFDLPEAPE